MKDPATTVWDGLIGQASAAALLERAATGDGMTHAWLITGPPGSGRSNAAVAFAAALQCENPSPRPGCGACKGCDTVLAESHADVLRVRTDRVEIRADEVRELVRRSALTPAGGKWQIIVIEDADRLNDTGYNALLKAIEEPSPRTVWVLCAPTVEDVLPTIRSRCRLLTLTTPPAKAIAAHLETELGVSAALAAYAARASQGHIGRAKALAGQEEVRNRRRDVVSMPTRLTSVGACMDAATRLAEMAKDESAEITDRLDAAESRSLAEAHGAVVAEGAKGAARKTREYAAALKALEKAQKDRAKRRVLDVVDRGLMDLVAVYRDAIAVAFDAEGDLINEEMRSDIADIARDSTPELNLRRIAAIFTAREQMLEHNVPVALALESMMVACRVPQPGR